MALLWCDGFDHYGSVANMTEGAWAQIGASVQLSTVNPRTGTHCIRLDAGVSAGNGTVRRVFGAAKTTVGIGAAFHFSSLPTGNDGTNLFQFRDTANAEQLTIGLQSTGIISVWQRRPSGGVLLGTSGSPVITANAYNHIEAVVFFSNTVGTVEVRVNGVTVISISGADTVFTANVEASQVAIGGNIAGEALNNPRMDIDDVFCYDNSGSYNNSFIGDRRVLTLFPDADTIQADWTVVGSATGYGALNEVPPNGDTSYITAPAPGSPAPTSEFGIQNLPAGISAVNAVVVVGMARKTEAGVADTRWSVISGASESAGADRQMTEIYTYRQDVFETDPATAAPFTASAVDALQIKVERVQ